MIRPIVPLALAALTLAGCGQIAALFPADRGPATPASVAPVAPAAATGANDLLASGSPEILAQEYVNSLYNREAEDDELVRFVSARAAGANVISEYETNTSVSDMSDEQLDEIGPLLSTALQENLCTEERARSILERGVSITLVLLDPAGLRISDVTVEGC